MTRLTYARFNHMVGSLRLTEGEKCRSHFVHVRFNFSVYEVLKCWKIENLIVTFRGKKGANQMWVCLKV